MPRLEPGKRGHKLLKRLADGPQKRWDLFADAGPKGAKKTAYALAAIQTAGLVRTALVNGYALTEEGLDVLHRLDCGEVVIVGDYKEAPKPNARVFV